MFLLASRTAMTDAPDVYELDSGAFAVFREGAAGRGVHVYHSGSDGWRFFPSGSLEWDRLHQAVFRNHKATPHRFGELARRGIEPPPPSPPAAGKAWDWSDNFVSALPLAAAPAPVARLLVSRPAALVPVYLVLEEDLYETSFGDGKFLYLESAFLEEERARSRRDALKKRTHAYALKQALLRLSDDGSRVLADLNIETYEHYGLDEILAKLSPHGGGPES